MDRQQIIMNFTVPPSLEDLAIIAEEALELLPEELVEFCDDVVIEVEDLADEATETELDLDDPFDLIVWFRKGSHVSPGVERKVANDDDVVILYRRPLLDMWCETGDDLNELVRQILIEELGQSFDFSEDEIEEMSQRHYQGML